MLDNNSSKNFFTATPLVRLIVRLSLTLFHSFYREIKWFQQ